jgi:hypothetical protein
VISEGLHCFKAVAGEVASHTAIAVGSGRQAVTRPEFRRVNTVLSNLKTAIPGLTTRSSLPSMPTVILPRSCQGRMGPRLNGVLGEGDGFLAVPALPTPDHGNGGHTT